MQTPPTKSVGDLEAVGNGWAASEGPKLAGCRGCICSHYDGAAGCKADTASDHISCKADFSYTYTGTCTGDSSAQIVVLNLNYLHGSPQLDPEKAAPPPPSLPSGPAGGGAGGPPSCKTGNPCNPANGNKYEIVTDFSGSQYVPGFTRTFNSIFIEPITGSPQGRWDHHYSRKVELHTPNAYSPENNYVKVSRAGGRVYTFYATDASNSIWVSEPDITDRLTRTASGWLYILQSGEKEEYDTQGRLLADIDASGLRTRFDYSAGKLASLTGPYGHALSLGYDTQKNIKYRTPI